MNNRLLPRLCAAMTCLWLAWMGFLVVDSFAAEPPLALTTALAAPQPIPLNAKRWQRTYLRMCAADWGGEAPCATLAAQIHQESGWHCNARSRVGAIGCAQFMPATARDYADEAGIVAPADPRWSFRAQLRYMRDLHNRIHGAHNECHRMSFSLAAYNGGEKWVARDRAMAKGDGLDPSLWESMQLINAGRSGPSKTENNAYADRIHRIAPRYRAARWGRAAC